MSLTLYFAPGACSFVPHALLEVAGAPFEPKLVKLHKGEQDAPDFRAINPRGQVPVLVDGSEVITQIVAIVDHLDRRFPEQRFLPPEGIERTRVLETLAWMNNTVHPMFTHVFRTALFAESAEAQAEVKALAAKKYAGLLQDIEQMAQGAVAIGEPFLAGDRIGPLDAYALVLLRWAGFAGIDPTTYHALWAHVQAVAQHPDVARAVERERLQLNLYKPA